VGEWAPILQKACEMVIASILLALVGLIALMSGLLLLVASGRAAATMGFGPLDRLAAGYAQFSGMRNLAAGALLLALAYAFGETHMAGLALFLIGAVVWCVTQLADAAIFLRLGSRSGALSAGALALILVVAALLAWIG
jgi:uncharacterized protein DUF4267